MYMTSALTPLTYLKCALFDCEFFALGKGSSAIIALYEMFVVRIYIDKFAADLNYLEVD